jgi:hypothetical protein
MAAIVNAFKREFGRDWLIMLIGFGAWCALGGAGYVVLILWVFLPEMPK